MSGQTYSNPLAPPRILLGAMSATDAGVEWLMDRTVNLVAAGTTLASMGTPIVSRADGQPFGAGDLAISATALVTVATTKNGITVQPDYGWTFVATGGGNATLYYVDFPQTLSTGEVDVRGVEILTMAGIG